jgi:hypothetical protein
LLVERPSQQQASTLELDGWLRFFRLNFPASPQSPSSSTSSLCFCHIEHYLKSRRALASLRANENNVKRDEKAAAAEASDGISEASEWV